MSKEQNPHRGSSFEEFLREDGIYEEVTAKASKRVADQDYDPCEGLSMTPKNVVRSIPTFLLGMVCSIPLLAYVLSKSFYRGLVKRTRKLFRRMGP